MQHATRNTQNCKNFSVLGAFNLLIPLIPLIPLIRHQHHSSSVLLTVKQRRSKNKAQIRRFKYLFMAVVTLYLPLSQFAVETLYCWVLFPSDIFSQADPLLLGSTYAPSPSPTSTKGSIVEMGSQCLNSPGEEFEPMLLWATRIGSCLTCIVITIAIPIQTYLLIAKNKPVGSLEDPTHRYNDEGDFVEYTDAMYQIDLKSDEQKVSGW
jgi:hypothetical protein